MKRRSALIVVMLVALVVGGCAVAALAQEAAQPAGKGIGAGLLAVGAGIAIGFGAVGTGIAQSRIGAAAAGVIAERPEMFGTMLILFVLPETLVIFGFLIAYLLLQRI